MRGTAAARVMSADGRWAYTLYTRPKGAPFVHALDTERRTAACIDLPGVPGDDLPALKLSRDGGTLSVRSLNSTRDGALTRPGPQALIDTRTFAVTRPSPAGAQAPRARADHPRAAHGAPAWPAAVIAIAIAIAAAMAALHRTRRRKMGGRT
jgi:hypothetical protein